MLAVIGVAVFIWMIWPQARDDAPEPVPIELEEEHIQSLDQSALVASAWDRVCPEQPLRARHGTPEFERALAVNTHRLEGVHAASSFGDHDALACLLALPPLWETSDYPIRRYHYVGRCVDIRQALAAGIDAAQDLREIEALLSEEERVECAELAQSSLEALAAWRRHRGFYGPIREYRPPSL